MKLKFVHSANHWFWLRLLLGSLPSALLIPICTSHCCFPNLGLSWNIHSLREAWFVQCQGVGLWSTLAQGGLSSKTLDQSLNSIQLSEHIPNAHAHMQCDSAEGTAWYLSSERSSAFVLNYDISMCISCYNLSSRIQSARKKRVKFHWFSFEIFNWHSCFYLCFVFIYKIPFEVYTFHENIQYESNQYSIKAKKEDWQSQYCIELAERL